MPVRTVKKPPSVTPARSISVSKIWLAAQQEATGAKTSSYLVTTAATGLVFTLISLLCLSLVPPAARLGFFLVLSFVFALIFSPLRYAMEEFIRQAFPGTDYDSHLLVKSLNTISYSSLTLDDLSTTFFSQLAQGFNVPETAFLFIKTTEVNIIKTSDRFQNVGALPQSDQQLIIRHAQKLPHPTRRFDHHEVNHLLDVYHIKLVLPLFNNTDLVGLLLLGNKDPIKPYTTKDYKVLEAIAPKIGFAIKNAFAYEKIQAKNARLFQELKQSNEQLRFVNQRLRKDDKLKDEFLFISTHELKNPIPAMKGYLSLIKEGMYGRIPVKLRPAIEQIDASNEQLINLLNNLLQIARYEAQRLVVKPQQTAICPVIDQVLRDLKPLAVQKNLQLVHNCRNPAVKVMADKDRLREIMSNLLGNAIKYSDRGMITISHEIIQDKLVTHIQDEGVGIAKTDQAKIFTRFFRVEEEAARGIPGSGLGLFIVKKMLEKMAGTIWFTSVQGAGSTFSFAIPLAQSRPSRPVKS